MTQRQENWHFGPTPDRHIVILGGCGGIGFATVKAAMSTGLRVTVLDLPSSLQRRELPKKVDAVPVDLCDSSSIKEAVSKLEYPIDHLVVAAGVAGKLREVRNMTDLSPEIVWQINFHGPYILLRLLLPLLNKDSSIVVLTTAIGQLGAPGYSSYGTAKSALNAMIRHVALEEAPDVRVNGIAPGAVDTAFIRDGFAENDDLSKPPVRFDREVYERKVPMGRMATPEDIVGPIFFLLSDHARHITGQILHVNGGAYLRD